MVAAGAGNVHDRWAVHRWAVHRWRRRVRTSLAALIAGLLAAIAIAQPALAEAELPPEQELAERYAPIVVVKQQQHDCDTDGEPFEPAPVEIVLDNPEIFLRQVGNGDPVAMAGPSASDLFDLREGWYLDFPGDALNPGCVFEQDFWRFYDGQSVVYAYIATEADRPGMLALQYWMFWYHNPAKNNHEGDWEFIQLLFDVATPEEALTVEPIAVGYAQHTGGERSDWSDPKLERMGSRPIVYAAKGSHASYFGSAVFLMRDTSEGFGCDTTDGPSRRLDPDVVLLPDEVTDPDDPLAWLSFQGRWGQRESGFFNGPTGPFAKSRWTQPVTWQEGLRGSSVVIPGGDRVGDGVVNTFCSGVELGSAVLVAGLRSPGTLLFVVGLAAIAVTILLGRTRWRPVATRPVAGQRAIGQILGASVRVWRDHPFVMLAVGLIYIPVALAESLLHAALAAVPFVGSLVGLAGGDRGTLAFALAILIGGVGNLFAFAYVSAAVARVIHRGGRDRHGRLLVSPLDRTDLTKLFGAVGRAAVVVIALFVTVVGIPWGIRQLVRYQLIPQVVAIEGSGGSAAVRRSSELVRTRWWWTAAVIATLQLTITTIAVGVSLFVLVVATSIPLWLFNVVSSLIHVVLVPVAAAAMTYVYGTRVAQPAPIAEDVPTR